MKDTNHKFNFNIFLNLVKLNFIFYKFYNNSINYYYKKQYKNE